MKVSSCPVSKSGPLKRGDLRDALIGYARAETDMGRIDQMSLRAAARDLGVSSGAVYRHFEDKDALLKAVAFQGFLDMRQAFFSIRPEGDRAVSAQAAVARAFRIGRAFVSFAQGNPSLWRMMFGRIGVMCREDQMWDSGMRRYTMMDVVTENYCDLHAHGGIPRAPDIEDVRFSWSAIHGAADLLQCGARLDCGDIVAVADQTTTRSLRALACRDALIAAGRNETGTLS